MAKLNHDQVVQILQQLFRRIAPEFDFAELDMNTSLREQVEIDSYDFYNLIVKLHEETGVSVPDSELRKLKNLNELISYVVDKSN
jgi:acyl carrier protein